MAADSAAVQRIWPERSRKKQQIRVSAAGSAADLAANNTAVLPAASAVDLAMDNAAGLAANRRDGFGSGERSGFSSTAARRVRQQRTQWV